MDLKQLRSKVSATGVLVAVLFAAFLYTQWPTRVNTKMVDEPYVLTEQDLGFTIHFEGQPETEGQANTQVYVYQRKGLSTMIQVSPKTDSLEDWIEKSKSADLKGFSGQVVLDWNFKKSGSDIFEYAVKNNNGYVNHVRITQSDNLFYKWVAGYKDKENTELRARILSFLDSFSLTNQQQVN